MSEKVDCNINLLPFKVAKYICFSFVFVTNAETEYTYLTLVACNQGQEELPHQALCGGVPPLQDESHQWDVLRSSGDKL